MEWTYAAYGLRLLVDGRIPGLSLCPVSPPHAAPQPDVRVYLNNTSWADSTGARVLWYETPMVNSQGRPNLTIWRLQDTGEFHFAYDSQVECRIAADGSQVWCRWPETATVEDAAVHLRGPILGFVLRLRGVLCLHASAVALGPAAIALVGPPGAGKSTTAAAFVKFGYSLLADDVTALSQDAGGFHVSPGYPQLNLWADAVEALYGDAAVSARLTPRGGINDWWDKRYVALDGDRQFRRSPLPLAIVYILGDRTEPGQQSRITDLSAQDAFMTLTDATTVNYALDDRMRALEFQALGHLVRTTPVRLVTPPDQTARLPDLCQTILDDYRRRPHVLPS